MNFVSTCPGAKLLRNPILNLLGGSVRILGNMNRAVPKVHKPNVVASDVKPMLMNDPSTIPSSIPRLPSSTGTGLGFGFAYSGLGGIGGTGRFVFSSRGAAGLVIGDLSAASALDIGPGFDDSRAAVRILLVSF